MIRVTQAVPSSLEVAEPDCILGLKATNMQL